MQHHNKRLRVLTQRMISHFRLTPTRCFGGGLLKTINMNRKHTPAPWNYDGSVIMTSNGRLVFYPEQTLDQKEANAKLIASAPELLEALEELMKVYERNGQLLSFDVNIARNAIKKATE